jgi:hypothetical protein
MLLLNSSCGSGKTLFFLVGAKKITSKQWLFDKNIVLVFLFDGAVRPQKNDGCLSRIYGIPFGEKRIAAQTGDFLVRNREKNTRRSVSFLRRRARPLADTGKLKNLGKGEKRQFLLRDKKPGMRDTAKHSSAE